MSHSVLARLGRSGRVRKHRYLTSTSALNAYAGLNGRTKRRRHFFEKALKTCFELIHGKGAQCGFASYEIAAVRKAFAGHK